MPVFGDAVQDGTPSASHRIPRRMGLVLATTFGLVVWIVLWALGYSGLDSGLLAIVVMILGATGRIALRHLTGAGAPRGQ